MKLGLNLGYWGSKPVDRFIELAQIAERLGFDIVCTAEAYGSDVFTPLAAIATHTSRIRLGTAIMQISARTPACAAMTALTLDHLSNGRLCLGIGVSGPQVVEGWYGRPSDKPLARTREYVDIIRQALRREGPLEQVVPARRRAVMSVAMSICARRPSVHCRYLDRTSNHLPRDST